MRVNEKHCQRAPRGQLTLLLLLLLFGVGRSRTILLWLIARLRVGHVQFVDVLSNFVNGWLGGHDGGQMLDFK